MLFKLQANIQIVANNQIQPKNSLTFLFNN